MQMKMRKYKSLLYNHESYASVFSYYSICLKWLQISTPKNRNEWKQWKYFAWIQISNRITTNFVHKYILMRLQAQVTLWQMFQNLHLTTNKKNSDEGNHCYSSIFSKKRLMWMIKRFLFSLFFLTFQLINSNKGISSAQNSPRICLMLILIYYINIDFTTRS